MRQRQRTPTARSGAWDVRGMHERVARRERRVKFHELPRDWHEHSVEHRAHLPRRTACTLLSRPDAPDHRPPHRQGRSQRNGYPAPRCPAVGRDYAWTIPAAAREAAASAGCRSALPPDGGKGQTQGERGLRRRQARLPAPRHRGLHRPHPRGAHVHSGMEAGSAGRGHRDGDRQRLDAARGGGAPRAEPGGRARGLGTAGGRALPAGGSAASPPDPLSLERLSKILQREPLDGGGALRGERVPLARYGQRRPLSRFRRGPRHHDGGYRAAGPGNRGAPGAQGIPQWPGLLRRRRHLPRPELPRRSGSRPRRRRCAPSKRGRA